MAFAIVAFNPILCLCRASPGLPNVLLRPGSWLLAGSGGGGRDQCEAPAPAALGVPVAERDLRTVW
jgi:hypothetical protein